MLLKLKDDKDGMSVEGELDLSPGKEKFNPLESWVKAGQILGNIADILPTMSPNYNGGQPQPQTFTGMDSPMAPNQNNTPGMSYGTPEDYGVDQTPVDRSGVPSIPRDYNNIYGQSTDYGVSPTTQYHPPGPMNQMSNMPNQQGPDPTSLAMQNMPYDLTGAMPNAFEGAPPPTTGYGTPNAGGGLQEPSANFPPPGYPSNVPTPDGQTFTQPPNTGVPGAPPMPTAEEGMDAQVSEVEQDWNSTMDQAEVPSGTKQQAAATIATSASQNNGTNSVGGQDASADPAMIRQWGELAYDPTKRKEEYTKKMNTIFMQSMLLDVAANAMGVKSRAGAFMDHQMKVLEGQMKFDDQQRLYDITQAVFYPNGTYDPPASQGEAFERAISLGATIEEASAITGYMPADSVGFDTYFKPGADGNIETIYVPKGQAPPAGATDQSGVAIHNADNANPVEGKDPNAMVLEAQVNEWRVEAEALEAAGNASGAAALRQRADSLEKMAGGASTGNEFTMAQANTSWNGLYGGMIRSAADYGQNKDNTMRDASGNYIPWSIFKRDWLNSYTLKVMGRDGIVRDEPGWLSSRPNPTAPPPKAKLIAQQSDIQKLRENPTPQNVQFFIEAFGKDQLPEEYVDE